MVQIEDFEGMIYARDGAPREKKDYEIFSVQYATSSHGEDHHMTPGLVIRPKGDRDVQAAIRHAKKHNLKIAVKSGGHQYSGASSTDGNNIQLDLSQTYPDLAVKQSSDQTKVYVCAGVSNKLKDFNAYLKAQGLFIPHGQCAFVCVGGHGQTGGYGQLGRSFGLFGDHIRSIRLITHDAVIKEVTKENDKDLFWAITGGSPGNFGVITHYTLEVYQDDDYKGSPSTASTASADPYGGPRGIKAAWIYSEDILKKVLDVVATMADNPDFSRNFDLCVSVLSMDFPLASLLPKLQGSTGWGNAMKVISAYVPDKYLALLSGRTPPSVIVYAQWCPTSKDDKYDNTVDAWFQQFRDLNDFKNGMPDPEHLKEAIKYGTISFEEVKVPMSAMTGQWIFPLVREYPLPYEKRTYSTNSTSLTKDGWVEKVADRIDVIYNPEHYKKEHADADAKTIYASCKLAVQIQPFGGTHSRFSANRDNGTSYSWRDTTVCQVLDCFYDVTVSPDAAALAKGWQAINDDLFTGKSDSSFSKSDRRFLWGSYGDWDLKNPKVWQTYYEDREKYEKLGAQRAKADPHGTFTPNPFAVEARPDKCSNGVVGGIVHALGLD